MKLNTPSRGLFYAAVVIFILGILAALISSLRVSSYAVWLVSIAFLILAIGSFTKAS